MKRGLDRLLRTILGCNTHEVTRLGQRTKGTHMAMCISHMSAETLALPDTNEFCNFSIITDPDKEHQ